MGVFLWLVIASAAVLLGIGMMLMRLLCMPVARSYPSPGWRSECHCGA